MIERNWKSVRFEIHLLSMLLSFTFLAIAWIVLGAVKFHIYGIDGWDYHWRVAPSWRDNVKAFWELHLRGGVLWMALGCAMDYFCWPYFLRKENSFRFYFDD